jgi:hypothetical protein
LAYSISEVEAEVKDALEDQPSIVSRRELASKKIWERGQ